MRKSSRAMSIRGSAFSSPWLRFHGVNRADVYIIIRVRTSRCGESALNPPTSQHISRRRPAPAPHSDAPFPPTSTPRAATMHARRPHNPFPTEDLRPSRAFSHSLPAHFHSPAPRRCTPAGCAMHSSPTAQPIPRRRPSLAPHSDTPSQTLLLAHAAPTHARRLRHAFLAALTAHSPPKTSARPRTATRPSRALPRAPAAPTHARRLRDAFLADFTIHSPPKTFARPLRSASGTKKRHRTVDVRCRMSRSTVVAVGHWGW